MKKQLMAMFLTGCAAFGSGAKNVTEFKFESPDDLKNWFTVTNKTIPDASAEFAKHFSIVTENGTSFLRTGGGFGILGNLTRPIEITEQTEKIEVSVTMRQKSNSSVVFSFALTSRSRHSGGNRVAFRKAGDSGFGVIGCNWNNQSSNMIFFRINGESFEMNVPVPPFTLIDERTTQNGTWYEGKLLYDHVAKTLSFFGEGGNAFVLQRDVDLSRVILSSITLISMGWDFQKVMVKEFVK